MLAKLKIQTFNFTIFNYSYIYDNISRVDPSVLRHQTARHNSLDDYVSDWGIAASDYGYAKLSCALRAEHFDHVFGTIWIDAVYWITC